MIGSLPPDADDVERALAGRTTSEVGRLNDEGGSGPDKKVLSAYVPVRFGGDRRVGVFELYQDYTPIAQTARDAFLPVAAVLALVLLALYGSLFPILRRVTRRLRRQMQEIEHQALHDALTELPNRLLFADRVQQALLAAGREASCVAVMLLDLDRFKEINDTLGHQSGDLLLQQLGPRLQSALRASDTVARLGGDEFAVLLPTVADPAAALATASKLLHALEEPFAIDGLVLELEASVGIAVFPEHGSDTQTLLRRADLAMYVAKEAHADTVLYDPEHDHYSPARLTLVADLRRALQKRELTLYYQPKASVEDGGVRTVEALVRWQHPERGLLPPADFIPLAEHTGLIRPLTLYVLEAALRQCRAWQDEGLALGVAVNLSGRDLLDLNLPDEVAALLAESGVPADKLELEITESTILTDPLRARAVLTRLSELGVSLAIDDFGSGYSSLGYLKRLPVDVLKIDKSFVMQMTTDENDAVIVRSTIDLGHNLGLTVVAEGVESEQVLDELARLGCDVAQGYHLSRSDFDATIETGEAGTKASAVVRAASVTTHDADRDTHLRSGDFFDVEVYPEVRFDSTRVEPTRDGAFRVVGVLTIKGLTREVELEATVLGTARDPWGNERVALEVRGEIDRTDFGLTWNQPLDTGGVLVGDTVRVVLDLSAVKSA